MSQEHATDCGEVLLRLFEYLDGEMSAAEAGRFADHLRACSGCLAEHDADRAMQMVVRRACAPQQAPATLRASIMTSITTVRIRYNP